MSKAAREKEAPPTLLEIHLLGPFRVLVDGLEVRERDWSRRKPKLLLKLLALQPHHQLHKEQAIELLWPEADLELSVNNLHKTIHLARHALEPALRSASDSHFIITLGQQIHLRSPGRLWIDIEAFERSATAALKGDEVKAYEAALALYEGDLLAEDLYEDWVTARRERLRMQYQELLGRLAQAYEKQGEYGPSIERLKALIASDSSNEEAHRRLMLLYARTGNRHQALKVYQQCCEALRRELDAEPERATSKLRSEIISGQVPQLSSSRMRRGQHDAQTIDSLAILPLANSSDDPNAKYLSDGITESLINSLSQLPQLRVIARTTVFRYKGQDVDPQEVGHDLDVDAVLTGEVQERGDSLIIQVDLINVADGSQLWGEQYKHRRADPLTVILSVQDSIAQGISEKLRLRLTGAEKKLLTKRYTESSDAYQAYLKGRYHWNRRIKEGFRRAIEYFNQAIGQDPNYALAYAGLAECYAVLSWYSVFPPKESFPRARAAAMKALEMDDGLAEAHNALAFIKQCYDWDWPGAEREFERAIELNPGYATAHHWYGMNYLAPMQRHEESIAEVMRARELDPLSLVINRDVGWVFYYARRYREAIEAYRRTFELDPDFVRTHLFLGMAYEQQGDYKEAIAEFHETKTHRGSARAWTLLAQARAHTVRGKKDDALRLINELEKLSKRHYVSPYLIATIYTGLMERDQAFQWLEKAYQERDPYLINLNVEPVLDYLRSDPRFTNLLLRVGLAP